MREVRERRVFGVLPPPEPGEDGRYSGDELGAWRAMCGVSQAALAAHLNVSREAVKRLEAQVTARSEAGERFLRAVEYVARRREQMMRDGILRTHRLTPEERLSMRLRAQM